MTLYALIPTRRPEYEACAESDDPQSLDYLVMRELGHGRIGDEEGACPIVIALPRTCDGDDTLRPCAHAEPEVAPLFADDMPRADLIHL
jgi:hypothetical protein